MSDFLEEIKAQLENADPFRTWWPYIVAAVVFLGTIVKSYMSGQFCPNANTFNDLSIILITGADGGKKEIKPKKVVDLCWDIKKLIKWIEIFL